MSVSNKPIRKDHETGETLLVLPPIKAPKWIHGFLVFLRTQGVVGLAVGLVLGIGAKSVVDSMVNNIFNPIVGLLYVGGGDLNSKYICLKSTGGECINRLGYGSFINSIVSFVVVAAAVYFLIKGLKLDKLDKVEVKE